MGGSHRNGHSSSCHSISSNNNVGWKLSQMFADLPDDAPINKILPKELLLKIFSYLDVVSLCRCAQVRLRDCPMTTNIFPMFLTLKVQLLEVYLNLDCGGDQSITINIATN